MYAPQPQGAPAPYQQPHQQPYQAQQPGFQAQYQQQPPFQQQQQYQQPQQYGQAPYQQGYQQSVAQGRPMPNGHPQSVPPSGGFPPAKRQKGNGPVITRYAPPPGYRGGAPQQTQQPPAQQFNQNAFQQNQGYQQPVPQAQHQPFTPQQASPPFQQVQPYQSQGYQQTQGYQQAPVQQYQQPQSYQQAPNFQQPQQGFQQPQAYQAPAYQPQGYQPQQPVYPQQQQQQGYQAAQGQGYPQQQPYQQPAQQFQQGPVYPNQVMSDNSMSVPTPTTQQSYNQAWPQQQPPQPQPTPYQAPPPFNGYQAPPTPIDPNNGQFNGSFPPPQPMQQPQHQPGPTPPYANPVTGGQVPIATHRTAKTYTAYFSAHSRDMMQHEDWGFDYDPDVYAKDPDAIDPDLSLGIITWHPPEEVSVVLPAFPEEIEAEMKKPFVKIDKDDPISRYFTKLNRHEQFLDIRKKAEWVHVKNDPAFFALSKSSNSISVDQLKSNLSRDPDAYEVDMQIDDQEEGEIEHKQEPQEDGNVMDSLEQALSSSEYSTGDRQADAHTTNATTVTPDPTRPKRFAVDENQEDILAKLGVTGMAKPVYPTPGPARVSIAGGEKSKTPEVRERSRSRNRSVSRNGGYGMQDARIPYRERDTFLAPNRLASPMSLNRNRSPSYDPWAIDQPKHMNGHRRHTYDGIMNSPARSEASQHTLAGSDFGGVDIDMDNNHDAKPPVLQRAETTNSISSRKRNYDYVEDHGDGKLRQYDDTTHKFKRRQPRVAEAFK